MDGDLVGRLASRAGETGGVEGLHELGIADLLVHQLADREIHGRLGPG